MTDVDAVLFDLDDTLVAYTEPSGAVLSAAFERVGVDPIFPIDAYYARYETHLERHDSIRDLRRACFADAAAEVGHGADLGHAVADAFHDLRAESGIDLLPGALEALDALDGDHLLGVVTNGPPDVQGSKLSAVGLEETFGTVVYAGFDTRAKPHSAPFRRALDALDASADRAVHVGNSLASDVAGARAAGLRSAYVPAYSEESDETPDYHLDSLSDLVSPPWLPGTGAPTNGSL